MVKGDYIKPHPDTKTTNYHDVRNIAKALIIDKHDGTITVRILEGSAYDKQRGYTRHASGSRREFIAYDIHKWVPYDSEEIDKYEIW